MLIKNKQYIRRKIKMAMKYVYNNKSNVVFFDEKVKDAEFASIEDVREEIENIMDNLKSNFEHGDYPVGVHDLLGIELTDNLVCKEDVFVWNKDYKEYESIETMQQFDEPYTWLEWERVPFAQILLQWVMCNDHTYDLYKFIREVNEDYQYAPMLKNKNTEKFERLFKEELKTNHQILEHYEASYEREKKEYEEYIANKGKEEMLNANVEGGIN
jgi:hypothetical protein